MLYTALFWVLLMSSFSTIDDSPEQAVRPTRLQDTPHSGSPPPGSSTSQPERSLSDMCFIGLFWAIVLTLLWKHIWIMSFLPLLIGIFLVKKLGELC